MDLRILKTIVALIAVGSLGLSGCSWFGEDPDPSPSPSDTPTVPSTSPSTSTATPEPTASSQAAGPTVEDLEEHLDGIFNSGSGSGQLTCKGRGPIAADDAVECSWLADAFSYPDGQTVEQREGPIYVVVLDDAGRYAFELFGPGSLDEFPETTDCRTLMAPPDDWHYRALFYTSLLYYWITAGRPASMDDDSNGLPCETVYPAKVVARTIASPLVPGNDSKSSHDVADIVTHLEAVVSGLRAPGTARIASDDAAAILDSPAVTGMSFIVSMGYDQPMQEGGLHVTVLSDSGRYAYSDGNCCLTGPNPQDYDAGATCKQLSEPTVRPGKESPDAPDEYWPDGLSYGNAVYFWRMHGSPKRMDGDGDGKPCENVYAAAAVSKYFGSTLEP